MASLGLDQGPVKRLVRAEGAGVAVAALVEDQVGDGVVVRPGVQVGALMEKDAPRSALVGRKGVDVEGHVRVVHPSALVVLRLADPSRGIRVSRAGADGCGRVPVQHADRPVVRLADRPPTDGVDAPSSRRTAGSHQARARARAASCGERPGAESRRVRSACRFPRTSRRRRCGTGRRSRACRARCRVRRSSPGSRTRQAGV